MEIYEIKYSVYVSVYVEVNKIFWIFIKNKTYLFKINSFIDNIRIIFFLRIIKNNLSNKWFVHISIKNPTNYLLKIYNFFFKNFFLLLKV